MPARIYILRDAAEDVADRQNAVQRDLGLNAERQRQVEGVVKVDHLLQLRHEDAFCAVQDPELDLVLRMIHQERAIKLLS